MTKSNLNFLPRWQEVFKRKEVEAMFQFIVFILKITIDVVLYGIYILLVLITPLTNLLALFSRVMGTLFLLFILLLGFDSSFPTADKFLFILGTLLILASGYLLPLIKESIGIYFERNQTKRDN